MFDVSCSDSRSIQGGADYRSEEPPGYYDSFEVSSTWKIFTPEDTSRDFELFRESLDDVDKEIQLRSEYEQACRGPWRYLREVLNPFVRTRRRSYCYTAPSQRSSPVFWRRAWTLVWPIVVFSAKVPTLRSTQARLINTLSKMRSGREAIITDPMVCCVHCTKSSILHLIGTHPGNVYYALISRVVLGDPDKTKARKSQPAEGHHSILAETGGILGRYREFVVFDNGFLVAFPRT